MPYREQAAEIHQMYKLICPGHRYKDYKTEVILVLHWSLTITCAICPDVRIHKYAVAFSSTRIPLIRAIRIYSINSNSAIRLIAPLE